MRPQYFSFSMVDPNVQFKVQVSIMAFDLDNSFDGRLIVLIRLDLYPELT